MHTCREKIVDFKKKQKTHRTLRTHIKQQIRPKHTSQNDPSYTTTQYANINEEELGWWYCKKRGVGKKEDCTDPTDSSSKEPSKLPDSLPSTCTRRTMQPFSYDNSKFRIKQFADFHRPDPSSELVKECCTKLGTI